MTGLPLGQVPIRIFRHDNAVVYDDADGQGDAGEGHDIGRQAEGVEQNETDSNGDRDLDDDAHGAAPVEQKQNDDEGYCQHFFPQFSFNIGDGGFDQTAAVICNLEMHTFGQSLFYGLHFFFDSIDDLICILPIAHDDDAANDFTFSVLIEDAEPEISAHLHGAYVFYPDRNALVVGEPDIFEVLFVFDVAQTPDDIGHIAHLKLAPSDVIVVGLDFVHDVHEGDIVELEFDGIDDDLVLFFKAAEGGDLGNAGYGLQSEFDIPVLEGPLFSEVHA